MEKRHTTRFFLLLMALSLVFGISNAEAKTKKSHSFPKGYCTWGCANDPHAPYIAYIPFSGNAGDWKDKAKASGFIVKEKPYKYSIVVFDYGHVATVIDVDGKNFKVSEVNYKGFGVRSERWITHGSQEYSKVKGFILTRKAIKNKWEKKDKKKYKKYKKQYKKFDIWYDGAA